MRFIILFMASLLTGKEKAPSTYSLDSMPAPQYHYPFKSFTQIHKELKITAHASSRLMCLDNQYVGLKFDSFKKYDAWFAKARQRYYHKSIKESFDCDNFAFLYKALLTTSVFKKDGKKQILIGVILVKQKKDALGIEASAKHALNIIYTSSGWYVVEPQTGEYIEYKNYTNPILKFIF